MFSNISQMSSSAAPNVPTPELQVPFDDTMKFLTHKRNIAVLTNHRLARKSKLLTEDIKALKKFLNIQEKTPEYHFREKFRPEASDSVVGMKMKIQRLNKHNRGFMILNKRKKISIFLLEEKIID
jgi:hypothetical protein